HCERSLDHQAAVVPFAHQNELLFVDQSRQMPCDSLRASSGWYYSLILPGRFQEPEIQTVFDRYAPAHPILHHDIEGIDQRCPHTSRIVFLSLPLEKMSLIVVA